LSKTTTASRLTEVKQTIIELNSTLC